MLMKAFASGGVGKKATTTKTSSPSNKGRTYKGLSEEAYQNYRRMWKNDEIGNRTLLTRMQAEGASRKQLLDVTRP